MLIFCRSGTEELSFSLSLLERSLRDWCGRCDVLIVLEACDSDFDAEVPVPTMAKKGYVGTNDWKTMEVLSAGYGEINIDEGKNGEQDFLQRLARDLLEHREGWTAQERSDRICDWDKATPGAYRRVDEREGASSIVLAPMRRLGRHGSMPNAMLWEKDQAGDLRKMGIQP